MTIAERISNLLDKGYSRKDIAATVGCQINYVSVVKHRRLNPDKVRKWARDRARRLGAVPYEQHLACRRKAKIERSASVIAAVDAGMTYSQAAKVFGLKSRNVVAGMMNRRA